MFARYLAKYIKIALQDTPVVFIMGPRQCGKTTLVKSLIDSSWLYITLDDSAQLAIAKADPIGFIRNLPEQKVVLDEIQRIPELFVAIKQVVDENRVPGRFLLTGSANALLLPKLSDSLAGRMESIKLSTLSECEILSTTPTFLSKIFQQQCPEAKQTRIREHLLQRVLIGCFPEPFTRANLARSRAWYQNYISNLVHRDVKDLADIEHPDLMKKLIALSSFYVGKLVNLSEQGNKLNLSRNTFKKYLSLLEQLFLLERLPAWHSNEYKRMIKTPKLHAVDTGMICAVRGLDKEFLLKNPGEFGALVESFVYNELRKQAGWLEEPVYFYHFRDKDKVEVDIIIENNYGDYFAVEVKATATIKAKDFANLERFKFIAKDKFKFGVLLYDGDHANSFGENLFAVPISALWS